jgi:hypothetical protein
MTAYPHKCVGLIFFQSWGIEFQQKEFIFVAWIPDCSGKDPVTQKWKPIKTITINNIWIKNNYSSHWWADGKIPWHVKEFISSMNFTL